MIFLSYLSGTHVAFKAVLLATLLFVFLRSSKLTNFALLSSFVLLFGTYYSFVLTQSVDFRVWAQWGAFT